MTANFKDSLVGCLAISVVAYKHRFIINWSLSMDVQWARYHCTSMSLHTKTPFTSTIVSKMSLPIRRCSPSLRFMTSIHASCESTESGSIDSGVRITDASSRRARLHSSKQGTIDNRSNVCFKKTRHRGSRGTGPGLIRPLLSTTPL